MEFQVLGPLLVTDNGEPVYVRTGHKPRLLLALLLARAGQSVSTDSLVASIWGDQPPPSARRNLQQYVHHIRRVLGAERLPGRAVGYAVITGNELDATRFRELAAAGSEALAAGDVVVAGRRLREALLL
ncbi:AfsR/SARP family transcriptional regulator [Nonomuraea basaltis]|uniref:AfsR/SARP family transcriptional regulator n=1 Tax=Nonomuraea basaltis TaxID=2495887 RepID=UPI0014864AC6|nr:winged helix-turn-helix domain-containing protein [Nonomuraea basaltis]